jgi:peptide/nickel transport system substrate-binding protein
VRRQRRSFKLLALLIGLVLIGAACGDDDDDGSAATTTGGTSETTAPSGNAGGTVTYAAEQEYTAYNNSSGDQVLFANTLVLNMVQPAVFITDGNLALNLNTELMDSVELTSEDPQVVEYKINADAVWEDGEPIDCSDFYSFWIAQNGKFTGPDADGDGSPDPLFNYASTTGYENITTLECSDDGKTVTTTYDTPFADYKGLFGALMPAHIQEQETGIADITTVTPDSPDAAAAAEFWNTGWSGFDATKSLSGSWYRITDFTPGQSLTLERNAKYWGTAGFLDEIIFLLVPDATAQPQALANDEVQVITPQPNTDLVAQVAAISNVTSQVDFGTTFEHFDFNLANPILAEKEVRQAFALCINRQEIVDTTIGPLSSDAAVLNNRIFLANQNGYVDNSGDYASQDIAQAQSILEAAGWTDSDGDGIRDKDGTKLSFRIGRRDPNPRRQTTIQLAQTQCKPAGFDVIEDAAENFNSERLPASDYDVALFAWVGTPLLSSNQSIYTTGGGQNWNSYTNTEVDDLLEQGNSEFDEAARIDLYNQVDTLLWEDVITIPLYQFPDFQAYQTNINNVVYNGSLGVTWNANEWSIA